MGQVFRNCDTFVTTCETECRSNRGYDPADSDTAENIKNMSRAESVKLKSTDSIVKKEAEENEEEEVEEVEVKTGRSEYPGEKWRIIRNIVILSLAFTIQLTAYLGISNLQSSINAELGLISLATIYISLIFSTTFLPAIAIGYLGCKWTIAVSFATWLPYIAAQYNPQVYTLIPAAVATGLGAAPLWCAASTYLILTAEGYATITGNLNPELYAVRFFGLFFMISQTSQIWGNLITSTVLSTDGTQEIALNTTEIENSCGVKFVFSNTSDDQTLEPPSPDKISLITSVYMVCVAGAIVLVALFLDSPSTRNKNTEGTTGSKLVTAAFKLLKDAKQLLLAPVAIWMGISQASIAADFTAAFVTCSWGVSKVGYVMMLYGLSASITSIATGWLVKLTGRRLMIFFAAISHFGIILFLMNWVPSGISDERYKFFVVTGVWGLADGIWSVQLNAFYGEVFPGNEEAAYSLSRLWESMGYIAAYSYSAHLNGMVKLYLALIVMWVGFMGYMVVERMTKYRNNEKTTVKEKALTFELSTLKKSDVE